MTDRQKKVGQHYNIAAWGAGYFDVDETGTLVLSLPGKSPVKLPLLVDQLVAEGAKLPLLIRFADVLTAQVTRLYQAFSQAIATHHYTGEFKYVYPIKTNQQRDVVETILAHEQSVGLESGSKTELLAILGVARDRPITIVCNGYKDREYIQLALMAEQLGHQVFIIVELPSELTLILAEAKALGVAPQLGLRVRLASIAQGKWQNTGGEKSKFGLTARQVERCVDMLRQANCLSYLRILHCHLGSQISNIRDIQRGVNECAHYLANLHQLGAEFSYVDIGGGLAVDYEGTRSRSDCSMNYSWQEYANNVVQLFKTACAARGVPEPNIITESGRAITAHHAFLVTNIIDVESPNTALPEVPSPSHPVLVQMQEALQRLGADSAIEVYHDMVYYMGEAYQLFSHGVISIAERATAEALYQTALSDIRAVLDPAVRHHREVIDLIHGKLADKVFCNFSIFQSMPDVWAIQQVFPVLPLSELNAPPVMRGVLQDLTCDSDGMVERYIDGQGVEATLPLPHYDPEHPYLMGCFMVGAYQEILGDRHNLFGETDSVHVQFDANGEWQVVRRVAGDDSGHVLSSVNYCLKALQQSYQQQIQRSPLAEAQQEAMQARLQSALSGYTYFDAND